MQDILFWLQKYFKDFLIFTLIICCFSVVIYTTWFKKEDTSQIDDLAYMIKTNTEEKKEEEKDITNKIYVDIKGAIKKPGVYEVLENAIINDVIKEAGGLNSNAYTNNLNLSKKVTDEMVIYIYTKNEINKYQKETQKVPELNDCSTSDYIITECTENKSSIIKVDERFENKKEDLTNNPDIPVKDTDDKSLVNINTASIEDFTNLSGIGEAKAQKIIEYRENNGVFKSIEEIMKVSGIGEKLFAQIKDFITI